MWALKYTNNDVVPFVLEKKDGSKGSRAPFSVRTYLNRTMGAGKQGLIISDGYQVQRMDKKIPDFVLDEVNNDKFGLCFCHEVDRDNDMYMLYPEPAATQNTRILYMSFDEDNFSIFRLPLSCMGEFLTQFAITWDDLTAANGFPNWDAMAAVYGDWLGFSWGPNTIIPLGGGEHGELWRLTVANEEDNPQRIRGVTIATGVVDTITVTTDFNTYVVGDMINIEGVEGITGLNNTQSRIVTVTLANYTFTLEYEAGQVAGSYTENTGVSKRVIPFELKSKQFNPFVKDDKKLQMGYAYFYVTTDVSNLEDPTTGDPIRTFFDANVVLNDNVANSRPLRYQVNCTNLPEETQVRRWYKMWVNNTGKFVQLHIKNEQSGSVINIHAIMLGLKPVGRVI